MDEYIMSIRFRAGCEYEAWSRRRDILAALYSLEREYGVLCSEAHRAAALVEQDGGVKTAEAA